MYMYVYICMCTHVFEWQRTPLGMILQELLTVFYVASLSLASPWLGKAGSSVSFRDPTVSACPNVYQHDQPFKCILGMEFMSLWFFGNQFTNYSIFPAALQFFSANCFLG